MAASNNQGSTAQNDWRIFENPKSQAADSKTQRTKVPDGIKPMGKPIGDHAKATSQALKTHRGETPPGEDRAQQAVDRADRSLGRLPAPGMAVGLDDLTNDFRISAHMAVAGKKRKKHREQMPQSLNARTFR